MGSKGPLTLRSFTPKCSLSGFEEGRMFQQEALEQRTGTSGLTFALHGVKKANHWVPNWGR